MATKRTLRVGELIKREIADILCREIRNPKVGFVTVSNVEVTTDLRTAVVWVSVLGDEERRRESLSSLNSAAGFIQRELCNRIRLRYMPRLNFHLDTSVDHSMRIAQILGEIKEGHAHGHDPQSENTEKEARRDSELE